MKKQNGPIKMEVHAKRDGTCNIRINDERFSTRLHGQMVYHIYRHCAFVTTRASYDENAVAVLMMLLEDEIWEKLGFDVQVVITAENLDLDAIRNYYSQFQKVGCKSA